MYASVPEGTKPYDRNGDPANESLLPNADQERTGGANRDADTKSTRTAGSDRWSDRKLPVVMTERFLIASAVIAMVLLMAALLAGRASRRRRRRRSSREHLRVDLFAADRGR